MSEQEKIILEWGILICLFKATLEQQSMLYGQTQREAKMIFKRWESEGHRLIRIIEKHSDIQQIESVADVIHNAIHEVRKINYALSKMNQ